MGFLGINTCLLKLLACYYLAQMGQALPTITNAEEAELKNRLKALREMDE